MKFNKQQQINIIAQIVFIKCHLYVLLWKVCPFSNTLLPYYGFTRCWKMSQDNLFLSN